MKISRTIFFTLIFFLAAHCFAECTSFCFSTGDTILFGNNLDWYTGNGLVVVNKRNVSKTGCWYTNKPSWISKYGSITINQFGREFPSRGMNEAGLAIGEMTLSVTQFPSPDSRPAISLLQWIQYQLDNCATVEEVIATDQVIRIDFEEYHSHFLVADSAGNCVTMEWLNGKLVYHAHETMPVKALANETYSSCLDYYNTHPSPVPTGNSSPARFVRAAAMMSQYNPQQHGKAVDYAFSILRSVGAGDWTKWSLVFDITNRRFHVRTNLNSNIRYVDFSACDFSSATPVKIFQLDNQYTGNVRQYFIDYDYNINRASIYATYNDISSSFGDESDWVKNTMANYPDTTVPLSDGTGEPVGKAGVFRLHQNYPNPFNPATTISWTITETSHVILSIYNLNGQKVDLLVDELQPPGEYHERWLASGLTNGLYFCDLRAGEYTETKKLVLLR